ncbi:LolA family protein [Terribacillus halophilus]|jgi:outer membrane lipoprotein-sorting protein|uniref:LolA family protein n=1 Tax=Terribacillus halophilus TaxID=361279 RepID=UPI000986C4A1|nr:outer membrane lipoprotein carrier protein LolA [Terribacillus halophilus]
MKKFAGMIVFAAFLFLLAGCGEASQEDVVKKLEETSAEMKGYKAEATMKLNTGEEQQAYGIDIWYQKDDNYRVLLKNGTDEQGSQVILRNKDGVFVLTPAMKKSFKFQSEWPYNSSQPYLFQSLVQDVLKDSNATFEMTEEHYIFRTKTTYQNNTTLPYQEIYFNKKTYTPELVKVLDKDKKPMVEVSFASFKLDPKFEAKDFELENNMTSSVSGTPASAAPAEQQGLTVLYPTETAGATLAEEKEVNADGQERVILTYEGEKNFTLIQEPADVSGAVSAAAIPASGEPYSLGFTVGAITSSSLTWTQNGVDYMLASEELTREEIQEIATSISGQAIK